MIATSPASDPYTEPTGFAEWYHETILKLRRVPMNDLELLRLAILLIKWSLSFETTSEGRREMIDKARQIIEEVEASIQHRALVAKEADIPF